MIKSSDQLFDAIEKAALLSAADLEYTKKRWKSSDRGQLDSPSVFAKWLVTNQLLTSFQVENVLLGKALDLRVGNFLVRDQIRGGQLEGALIGLDPLQRQVVIQFGGTQAEQPDKVKQNLVALKGFAKKINSLDNRSIQKVVGQGSHKGRIYVAREWWDGCTLAAAFKRSGKVEAHKACKIFASVLSAAEVLHEAGLPVGIVEPESIYLAVESPERSAGRVVKLLGAGIPLEFLGISEGKPQINHSKEVFSIGCAMYQVVTGEPYPQDGKLRKNVASVLPEVSENIAEYIDQMSDPEPGIRFENAKIAGKALRILVATEDAEEKRPHAADPLAEVGNFSTKNQDSSESEGVEEEEVDWLSGKVNTLLERVGVSPRELAFLAGGALVTVALLLTGLLVVGDLVPLVALGLGAMGGYYLNAWLSKRAQAD
jgi:serine/threonine protein kinase